MRSKRVVGVLVCLMLGFAVVYKNIADTIYSSQYVATSLAQSRYKLDLGRSRGSIYDRWLRPMVNQRYEYSVGVLPLPSAVATLRSALGQEQMLAVLSGLEGGKPAKLVSKSPIPSAEGLAVYKFPVRYSDTTMAQHIIGYMSQGVGVSGIERGYNSMLQANGGGVELIYTVDATGAGLGSGAAEILDTRPYRDNIGGVVLTLDSRMQSIAETAMNRIKKGALVLLDVHSGEVLAAVSRPTFSYGSLSKALAGTAGEMLNRATAGANVGSVFKPFLAGIALDKGIGEDKKHVCTGSHTVDDTTFYCHNRAGHGEIDMAEAMRRSCNVYFMKIGEELGIENLTEFAMALDFGENIQLADGITATSSMPPIQEITKGELMNLSFGQGQLMASPVHIASLMATIANGGVYTPPRLYMGETLDGYTINRERPAESRRIFSENTAKLLRRQLSDVVAAGSGRRADSAYCATAGKTGSAQTGQWESEGEIINGWFAGFFPADNPHYAIAVLEVGGEGSETPAEIFSEVADGIMLLDMPRLAPTARARAVGGLTAE